MRGAILHTICSHPQVKGSLRLTALNIAYKCDGDGRGRVAQSYLAKRTGLHVRTIRRHIKRLAELDILCLTLQKCARTLYQFCVAETVRKRVADKLPAIKQEERKIFTRAEIIRLKLWLARPDTPRGIAYEATREAIHHAEEGILHGTG